MRLMRYFDIVRGERLASDGDRDAGALLGQEDRCLPGGVAAANHHHLRARAPRASMSVAA